jgi:hypothetical protein
MAAYRNDVDALSARHDSLAAELMAKTKEVNEAARLLEEARTKARLPVLENIRVATPCRADWNQMTGDERTRHCGDCKKNIYNLSNMTRDEAEALIVEKEGKLCARYYQRHDGTILLKDCSIGIGVARKRRIIAVGAMALLGGAALFAYKRTRTEDADAITCRAPSVESTGIRTVSHSNVDQPPPAIEAISGQMIETIQGKISHDPEDVKLMLGDIK